MFQCVQLSDGAIIKLRVLDTAGQEKFNAIRENYYRYADCCLLVYDITSTDSFHRIKKYYVKKIKENCSNIKKVVLLGNKTDLENRRQVSVEEGRDLALENGYIFMESSCKDNYNVSDAFTALVEMTNNENKKKKKINKNNNSFNLGEQTKTKNSCC